MGLKVFHGRSQLFDVSFTVGCFGGVEQVPATFESLRALVIELRHAHQLNRASTFYSQRGIMNTVLITGANRGLGLEFAKQYAEAGWSVIAVCRTNHDQDELRALAGTYDMSIEVADLTDFSAIDDLATKYKDRPIDVLINNAAVFGPKAQSDGDLRQTFGHMDYDIWTDLLRVNLMAPFKMVEAFIDNVRAGTEKKIIAISATPGSITETGKGLNAYRTTKAGLNMAMATLAEDLKPDGITVALFCPGWVKTRMGTDAAPLTPDVSIAGMRQLISELNVKNTGQFRRYNGDTIPW